MAKFAYLDDQKALINLDNVDLIEISEVKGKFVVVFYKYIGVSSSVIKNPLGLWSFDNARDRKEALKSIFN